MSNSAAAPVPAGRQRRSITRLDLVANARRAAARVVVGRPLLYTPELCDRAVALGMLGKSWAAIARDFGISRSTFNEWERVYPEFTDAMARARAAAQSWWEEHGQKNLKSKHYQAQVSRTIMAAQFEDYRESRDINVAVSLEGLISAVEDRAAQAKPVEVASSFEPAAVPAKGKI